MPLLNKTIYYNVLLSLQEDIGSADITAALIPVERKASARIISRQQAVICGRPWFDEVFRQIDPSVHLHWQIKEGERVFPGQEIIFLEGSGRSLLTGERCGLNFLQTLSGTATRCAFYANMVSKLAVKLLDTRKTLPGLRLAQKYAVKAGGCFNHRMGLYDAFLIKENHIAVCGGIRESVAKARLTASDKRIEVEVESLDEFKQARDAGADTILLDNFSLDLLKETVDLNQQMTGKKPFLEASGGVCEANLLAIAETGVDYISMGILTKDCNAVDLSMGLIEAL